MSSRLGILLIQEIDGSPDFAIVRLKVDNNLLTDNGDGSATLDIGGVFDTKTVKSTYFATVGSGTTTGTITIPAGTNATLIMDEWGTATDAILSTMENGKPTFISPRDSSGNVVTTTFDTSGNYTFSATPSPAADHAIIFVYTATLGDFLVAETLGESELVPAVLPTLKITGNFELEKTEDDPDKGVIYKDGERFLHDFYPTGSTDMNNLFIGANSGNFTMTAPAAYSSSFNTGVGASTLSSLTTGYQNLAFGASALLNVTVGSSNIAIGYGALLNILTSSSNIGVGNSAGRFITGGVTANSTGSSSIFIGTNSKALANGQTNQVVIGRDAIGIGANSVTLGNDSVVTTALKGNIGIGTTSPDTKLQVVGTGKFGEDTTNYTSFAADGELTLSGNARVKKVIFVDLTKMKLGVGNPPGETVEHGFLTFDFDASAEEEMFTTFFGPLDWDPISDATFHFAFFVDTAPVAAANVVWGIEYKSIAIDGIFDFTSGTSTVTSTVAITTGTPANDKKAHTAVITIPYTDLIGGGLLMARIFRDATNGSDTFTGDARLFDEKIEYIANKLGENL